VKTELNRLMVLAITLRTARSAILEASPETAERCEDALDSIKHAADELETIAAEPGETKT
jgi:hypothetical protein